MSGFSWSERTNSGMVKQEELWTNLSFSTCNLLIIAMSDLDKTLRECSPDVPFGIAIKTQNTICMIHLNTKPYSIDEFEKL